MGEQQGEQSACESVRQPLLAIYQGKGSFKVVRRKGKKTPQSIPRLLALKRIIFDGSGWELERERERDGKVTAGRRANRSSLCTGEAEGTSPPLRLRHGRPRAPLLRLRLHHL